MRTLLIDINGWAWGGVVICAMFLFFDLYDRYWHKPGDDPEDRA